MRKCIIKYFTFYYNSTCIVYKDTKYSTSWWLKKPTLNYASAIQELNNKQNRLYYREDMYSIPKFYNPVMHPVKSNKKEVLSNKDIF